MASVSQKSLLSQRPTVYGAYGRVTEQADRFPILSQLLSRIRFRRRRDSILLGAFVVFLLFLAYLYVRGRK
jgi:hypothetical protein